MLDFEFDHGITQQMVVLRLNWLLLFVKPLFNAELLVVLNRVRIKSGVFFLLCSRSIVVLLATVAVGLWVANLVIAFESDCGSLHLLQIFSEFLL